MGLHCRRAMLVADRPQPGDDAVNVGIGPDLSQFELGLDPPDRHLDTPMADQRSGVVFTATRTPLSTIAARGGHGIHELT